MASDQTVSPAFLYAALLWPAVNARQKKLAGNDVAQVNAAIAQASDEILAQAHKYISIPKRFSVPMREILALQPRFDMRRGGRAHRLLTPPRVRAAYDHIGRAWRRVSVQRVDEMTVEAVNLKK